MCFKSINLWLGYKKAHLYVFMFVLFLEFPALKWTGSPPLAVIPRRNPCPASIPHLDFRFPKFFGANFGYSLPFSVTGLSPVLLHKPLMLFLSRQFLPICVVLDKLWKNHLAVRIFERFFTWALAHSTFTKPDKRHHTRYVAHSEMPSYYSSQSSVHLMLFTAGE